MRAHAATIRTETLADRIDAVESLPDGQSVRVGDTEVRVSIERI
jgi:hypothetical protein